MKRLILRLVCFFLALLAVPLGYFAWVQSLPAMSRGSLMGSILIKQQLAENTPGARILVVGGSSVPYSIQCEVIQQQTGMPCIAMGATAYLGLEYYLSLLEDHLHQRDLVILAPEIVMLQDQVSYSTTWMAVENDPGLLAAVPLSYWPGMVSGYYTYSRQKLDLYRQKGAPTQSPQEQYEAFGFGPWGDIPGQRESLLESGYDKNNILTLTGDDLAPRVRRAIKDFAKKAQAVGAPRLYAGLLGRADRVVLSTLFPIIQYAACALGYGWIEIGGFSISWMEIMIAYFAIVGNLTAVQRVIITWRNMSKEE